MVFPRNGVLYMVETHNLSQQVTLYMRWKQTQKTAKGTILFMLKDRNGQNWSVLLEVKRGNIPLGRK